MLTILKVVYWFNPIVHIANSLIIDDMETACDAEVIEKIGVESRRAYAQTLISLFNTNNPFAFSGLAMGAGKGRIAAEKRIRGLFKPNKTRMSVKTISLLLVGIIGIVCFTTACQPTPEGPVVIGKSDGKLEKIIQSKADSEGSNANQNRQVDFSEYSESFQGADERVTININAEVTLPTGNMPVVEVKPRYIDMDQVKAMAEVLFQGSIAYEPKVGFSKADLEEEIIKHKQFISNEQAILEYYGGDQAIAEMVKAEFEKRIEEFEKIYQDAPNTIEVKETDWTFRPRAYYENMAILGNEFNEDDEESRELQKYYYDSDMIILDSKVLDYNARITVFNQDTTKNIYHYAHFSMGSSFIGNEGSIPTWDSLDSRPAKLTLEETIDMVQDTLAQMGITNMVLSDCYTLGKPLPGMMISDFSSASSDILKEDGINEVVDIEGNLDKNFIDKNEDEVYGYRMTFVPSYEGIAAHDVAPFSSLDSSASDQYAHTYPYEQLRVTVQNDVITSLYWDSPMEQVQVENSNVPVITLEEAIEIFKKQVKMEYTISKLLGSSDDIDSGEINITDICLGLMRIRIKDRPGAYRMVPAWTFLGYENLNYKDNDGNSQVTAPDSLYPYVVINAIDGSIIDISKGY